jgi:hypothetical protein
MEAPSSAREPHQVSRWSCRFAGSTSGTMSRAYSSLDSPCNRLALVCRLRNIVADVVRELLNIISQLHEHGRRTLTATNINVLLCRQTVHGAELPTDPRNDTLPDADRVRCPWIAHACAGGGSSSESFVGAKIYASGRSPSTSRSTRCPGDAQTRRSSFAAGAHGWLTVPSAHDLVLFGQQRPQSRTSSRKLGRLRTVARICNLSVLLVLRFVLAVRAHAERYRDHPVYGSSSTCTMLTWRELGRHPEKFLAL